MQTEDTQSWVERLSQDEAEECLGSLVGLAGQLGIAIDAIVKRQLPTLQVSLQLQQASCARLANIRHRSNHRLQRGPEPETGTVDSDLAAEIKAATESLLLLNGRYSALLKHSGDTLRLLAGLYRSYRGSGQSAFGMQTNIQTWSCEG